MNEAVKISLVVAVTSTTLRLVMLARRNRNNEFKPEMALI